ncbi:MAG: LON peptidase substrate-binding domain-containing protein [Betaproteobacteria bacterium]
MRLPLFPLKTVLFPGGLLPLKVFEQRYIAMTKACIADEQPFGVCLITKGDEVGGAPEFAPIGTLATIAGWDMPQPGILHLKTSGGTRFQVRSHAAEAGGLVVGEVAALPAEPAIALPARYAPLARLLDVLAERIGTQHFPEPRQPDDASWVGYRLAELLPLPLSIKQSMLEINDAEVRLSVLEKFLRQQRLL